METRLHWQSRDVRGVRDVWWYSAFGKGQGDGVANAEWFPGRHTGEHTNRP